MRIYSSFVAFLKVREIVIQVFLILHLIIFFFLDADVCCIVYDAGIKETQERAKKLYEDLKDDIDKETCKEK